MAQGNEFQSSGNIAADGSFTDSFHETYTDEVYPLGTIRYQSADEVSASTHTDGTNLGLKGDREWIFVKESAAIGIYEMTESVGVVTESFEARPCNAAATLPIVLKGVAQRAIPANEFGWVVRRGECVVKAEAGIAAGAVLDTHAAGSVDDGGTATAAVGLSTTATGTPVAGTVRAHIALP